MHLDFIIYYLFISVYLMAKSGGALDVYALCSPKCSVFIISSLGALILVHAPRAAAIAAKKNLNRMGIIRILTNTECQEGQFDAWGTFSHGVTQNLDFGGPQHIGARFANLTESTRPYLEMLALTELVQPRQGG